MTILDKLASSLNRRDEVPNQQLAMQIVDGNDEKAVKELVRNLRNRDREIQSDCIKVLYEVGERKPDLIAEYAGEFSSLLDSDNNRLVWGGMAALDQIALANPKTIYGMLPKIVGSAETGSVITRDHAVGILIKLASLAQYRETVTPLLIEQLKRSPTNQLPMYSENLVPIVTEKNRAAFVRTLTSRLDDIEKAAKRKRVERVIAKLRGSPVRG
ncbi:MAG: hypothetical protein E6K96_00870 [Thaumarchaeota archaeon]|nr:MAG: hypothetical protein E6K96_00870 [Nitrososphaerota archaeon]